MKRLVAALALLPTATLAHAGDHGHSGFLHMLTEPDHLVMIGIGVAVVAYGVYKFRARQ